MPGNGPEERPADGDLAANGEGLGSPRDSTSDEGTESTPCSDSAPPQGDHRPAPLDFGPKFEIVGELGAGSMGRVLKAWHRGLKRFVAIKVLDTPIAAGKRLARFEREAQVASDSGLAHPNIALVRDLDRTREGAPFIVMDLVEGRSLAAELKAGRTFALDDVVGLLAGVADALDQAHAHGVIHRDIKPANLMVGEDGVVRIVDFGICHVVDERGKLTVPAQTIGTPIYMAPEQILGDIPLPQTDTYALAAVAYEMLSGEPAFGDIGFRERLAGELPPRLDEIVPGLPPDVGAAVDRALSPRAADRFESATAFIGTLDRACGASAAGEAGPPAAGPAEQAGSDEAGVAAPRAEATGSAVGDLPAWKRHRRTVVVSLGAAAAIVALAVSFWPAARQSPAPDVSAALRALAAENPRPRLLVVPFASQADRTADRILWPLADRLIVNALEGDERILGRLERVDPVRAAAEIEVRELGRPPGTEAATELAMALEADLVLGGTVSRTAGRVRLEATLWRPGDAASLSLREEAGDVVAAARALAGSVRRALWGDDAGALAPDRLEGLLLKRAATATALLGFDPSRPSTERRALYERLLDEDPESLGIAWLLHLEQPRDPRWLAELQKRSESGYPPELRAYFESLAASAPGHAACEGLDARDLGRRYPLVMGPLAEAACLFRRGDVSNAVARAEEAHRELNLRALARAFLSEHLHYTGAEDVAVQDFRRLQQDQPEYVTGWSKLAVWYARADRMDEARDLMLVARSIGGTDRRTNYFIGSHGTRVHLLALDVAGAREWLDLMLANRGGDGPDADVILSRSLFLAMQGSRRESLAVLRGGLDELAHDPSDVYTQIATSLFYESLSGGRRAEASAVLDGYAQLYDDPNDLGDAYGLAVLRLALERDAGSVSFEDASTRLEAIGDQVVEKRKDVGRAERTAHECLFYAHMGARERSRDIVFRDPSSQLIGGCRYRYAELLEEQGKHAEALEQFSLALKEIVWLRFGYVEFVPACMLGIARNHEQLGDVESARVMYERITANYAHADHEMPEVAQAREALARLR